MGAVVVGAMVGWLFGWRDLPESDSPQGAVLRVQVDGNTGYTVEWPGAEAEHYTPHQESYRDHAIPAESFGEFGLSRITVTADGAAPVNNETPVAAILFLNGEYATCDGDAGQAYIAVDSLTDPGSWTSFVCGTYRFS